MEYNEGTYRQMTDTGFTNPALDSEDQPPEKPKDEKENAKSNYVFNLQMSNLELQSNKPTNIDTLLLEESKTVKRFSPLWKQTLAATASIGFSVTAGLTSGYSATLLPQLELPDSVIPGDSHTASWIASMAALPMAPGCLIGGWMMEKFGRKNAHILISIPFSIGWLAIAFANSLTPMLVGRFLTGLCVGLIGPLIPVYVGETTDPKYRGFFLAGVSLAISLGLLIAHVIGTFLPWQWTALSFTIFPILSVLMLFAAPESPTWLISKGKTDEGIRSFCWLRGYSEEAKAELKGILEKQKAVDAEPKMSFREKLVYLKGPEFIKPLLIMVVFFLICQFSGVNAIAFYSINIVEKSVGENIDHYAAMIIIDAIRAVASVVACVLTRRYGRRPLCLISVSWTAVSMVGLAAYLFWTKGQSENLVWIPLSLLVSYIVAISIGLVPLPWIMCGEVFPVRSRGIGSGITSAVGLGGLFVVVKTAPGMMKYLGEVVTFLIYGLVAAVGFIILYFVLPETKGKSLQEIEDEFQSKKNKTQNVV